MLVVVEGTPLQGLALLLRIMMNLVTSNNPAIYRITLIYISSSFLKNVNITA